MREGGYSLVKGRGGEAGIRVRKGTGRVPLDKGRAGLSVGLGKGEVVLHFLNLATSGIEPDLIAHEAIVTTFTPYRLKG